MMTEKQTYYLIALALHNLYRKHGIEKEEVNAEIVRISDGVYNMVQVESNE